MMATTRIVDGNIQNPNKYLLNSSNFFFLSILIVQCVSAYAHGLHNLVQIVSGHDSEVSFQSKKKKFSVDRI